MDSLGVIPRDSPTVPIAEKVSNIQIWVGISSTMLMIISASIAKETYINRIVAAFFTIESSTLLPK